MEEETHLFALKTTANREDQVVDFIQAHVKKRGLDVYSIIRPHKMRGYIFIEAKDKEAAQEASIGVPYAKGLLDKEVKFDEVKPMLEQVKVQMNVQINDIVEIIAGPFKREKAKVTRIDQQKEEIIVELLEAAVPIPITLKMDSVKVIRREGEINEEKSEDED